MPGKDDWRPQLRHTGRRIIEVADFEPEQHPIAVGQRGIADRTVVMLDVPAMQLEEQAIVLDEALVLWATVAAPAPQKTLVPTATCLDITDADQGLWTHTTPCLIVRLTDRAHLRPRSRVRRRRVQRDVRRTGF